MATQVSDTVLILVLMDNQNTSTLNASAQGVFEVLILVLMDNQNTLFPEFFWFMKSVLILVLMDNQNTYNQNTSRG